MNFATSLQAIAPLQALAATVVLLTLMDWRSASAGGRWATAGMASVALGLGLLSPLLAPKPWILGCGMALFSAGLSGLWWALSLWLKPVRGRLVMGLMPVLIGLPQVLLSQTPLGATALSDALIGVQLGMIFWILVKPIRPAVVQGLHQRRWRLLGVTGVAPLAVTSLWRALDGAWAFGPAGVADLALALSGQLALLLVLPVLLLAWRSETEAELARLAQTDGVTGLIDRKAFTQRSVDMFSMARRYQEPLALMLLEIDDFPALVREHGREAADRMLALFASCLQAQMRLGDVTGRVGDASFGVIMARTDALGPEAMDRRLRAALSERAVQELGLALGFSGGWGRLRPGDRDLTDLMRRAETALYEARKAGQGQLMAEPGVSD